MAKPSDKAAHRIRALGNRYADACLVDGDIVAMGVRYDEDDPVVGDSLVVRLRPGRAEALGHCSGIARSLAVVDGVPHVLRSDGQLLRLHNGAATLLRDGVLDLVAHGEQALTLDADGVVALLGATPATALGRVDGATLLASDGRRVVLATRDGVVTLDGDPTDGSTTARTASALTNGPPVALAVAGDVIAAVVESSLSIAQGTNVRRFNVGHPLHSVACFAGRVFAGSRTAGLFVLVDGDDRVRPLRPSLRARSLRVSGGRLVVAADLLVAVSDEGDDFVSRDLAAFIRLAEKTG
jgi:hypothetical protein